MASRQSGHIEVETEKIRKEGTMGKLKVGLIVGGGLGLLDGLSTFFAPEAVKMGMMPMIIAGSTVKGLVTGFLAGWIANRYRSLPIGIVSGLTIGLVLSFLVALMPDPQGNHHFFEIMLPGALLGFVVGFVCQKWGRAAGTVVNTNN